MKSILYNERGEIAFWCSNKNASPYFIIFLAIHFDLVHVKGRVVYLNFKNTAVRYAEEES